MKIAFGNDHIGLSLRAAVMEELQAQNIEVVDYGTSDTTRVYSPLVAEQVAHAVVTQQVDRGLLICGSGVGMCIAANKVNGIRAVVCSEPYTAKMSREHNHTNVLCIGSRVIGSELAKMIVNIWLASEYEGGTREIRYQMITDIERKQKENGKNK